MGKGGGESKLQGGEAFPDGILGEFSDAPGNKLLHDLLAVGIHCLNTDVEELGNLAGAFTLGYELQNLPLPGGEQGKDRPVGARLNADVVLDQNIGDSRAQVGLVGHGHADGLGQFLECTVLEEVAASPGLEHSGNETVI